MMSQEESFVEGEGGNEEDSDTDSSHSQETKGSGADEEDDMEENDEDEGEEDEGDDDDDDDDADIHTGPQGAVSAVPPGCGYTPVPDNVCGIKIYILDYLVGILLGEFIYHCIVYHCIVFLLQGNIMEQK